MSIFRPQDFPTSFREEIKSLLSAMHPLNKGPCWSLVCTREPDGFWFGIRRDLLTGPVLTLRSTFWCFGFDDWTPFSFQSKLIDNTNIFHKNGFKHTSRLISKALMGFVYENLTITIREEIQLDWT